MRLLFTEDVTTKLTLKGSFDDRRGEKFIKFDDSYVIMKYDKGYVDLGHLFGRTSLPSKGAYFKQTKTPIYANYFSDYVLNYTVNKHFDAFAEELLPLIEESMAIAVLNVANNIVQGYSFRQLFPH